MVMFSKPRLEGKALEQVLAGDARPGIRMRDGSTGKWVNVKTAVAKAALTYMKAFRKFVSNDS